MKNALSILTAVAAAGVMAFSSVAPAAAQARVFSRGDQERVIQTYCDRNPWDNDCRGFYRGGWGDRDYYNFYSTRRSAIDGIAAGILGLTFGAVIGSIIANGNNPRNGDVLVYRGNDWNRHVQACYNRYRSYDETTDTFLGYDGVHHRCQL